MEIFKVSHDSLFKNTLRILHEGIRHDLSIQTQDEMLTCNRDFLKIYPSLKEKIDESSQMLQLEESMHFWNSFTQEEKLRDCQEIDI